MEFDFTPDQKVFQADLRERFQALMTEDLVRELRSGGEGGGPEYMKAMSKLGQEGLLGVGWPKEWGGQGRSALEQFIFADEIQSVGFPLPFLTLNTVGPTLQEYATEGQKSDFVPRILAGELHFAIGYSEAGAGTDLAALTTSAVRDGNDWVINGAKMWTSLAGHADYIWLAARTDPSAKKHRGISMFLVPTDAPGFKYQRIDTVGGVGTNATFYDDVRVPADHLIGGENNGWALITGQLNRERISLMSVGPIRRALRDVVDWAREAPHGSGRVMDLPWVQSNIARVYAKIQTLRLMNWKQAWAATQGRPDMAASSAIKVYGSELNIEAYRLLMEVIGPRAVLSKGSAEAALEGRLDSSYRNGLILTFGGGTNEVQRDIIAMAGMGLPNYKD